MNGIGNVKLDSKHVQIALNEIKVYLRQFGILESLQMFSIDGKCQKSAICKCCKLQTKWLISGTDEKKMKMTCIIPNCNEEGMKTERFSANNVMSNFGFASDLADADSYLCNDHHNAVHLEQHNQRLEKYSVCLKAIEFHHRKVRRRLYSEAVDLSQSPTYSSLAEILRPSEADVAEVGMCTEPVEDVAEMEREEEFEEPEVEACAEPVEDVAEMDREEFEEPEKEGCAEPVEDVAKMAREEFEEPEVEACAEPVEDVAEMDREEFEEPEKEGCAEPVEDVAKMAREEFEEPEVEGCAEPVEDVAKMASGEDQLEEPWVMSLTGEALTRQEVGQAAVQDQAGRDFHVDRGCRGRDGSCWSPEPAGCTHGRRGVSRLFVGGGEFYRVLSRAGRSKAAQRLLDVTS